LQMHYGRRCHRSFGYAAGLNTRSYTLRWKAQIVPQQG
jgi:hypothetical protein